MEIIKREISINNLLPDGNIYIKIPLTQNIEDLGMSTDIPTDESDIYQKDYQTYYKKGGRIIMASDSNLEAVRSYKEGKPYIEGFDITKGVYNNYEGQSINGASRVTSTGTTEDNEITYVIDANKDVNIGTSGQTSGILYVDYPIEGLEINSTLDVNEMTTRVEYMSEGWNRSNTSIDPQIQEEYLLGIISTPEVNNDVFIDRGSVSILDKHLRLSEIESLTHLTKYGNGFYNINKE